MASQKEDAVTHTDIMLRLKAGDARFARIEKMLREMNKRSLENADKLATAAADAEQAKKAAAETKEIVEAWTTVKNAGRFVKWFSGIVTALGVIIIALKGAGLAWIEWGAPKH